MAYLLYNEIILFYLLFMFELEDKIFGGLSLCGILDTDGNAYGLGSILKHFRNAQ